MERQASEDKSTRNKAGSNQQGGNAIRFGSEVRNVRQSLAYTALQDQHGVAFKGLHEVRGLQ